MLVLLLLHTIETCITGRLLVLKAPADMPAWLTPAVFADAARAVPDVGAAVDASTGKSAGKYCHQRSAAGAAAVTEQL